MPIEVCAIRIVVGAHGRASVNRQQCGSAGSERASSAAESEADEAEWMQGDRLSLIVEAGGISPWLLC